MSRTLSLALAATLAAAGAAAAQADPPRTHAPRPTTAALSAADLRTRLYQVADDSMAGRKSGTPGNVKATDYIARELRRVGLRPAGENGTFFQTIPLVTRGVDRAAALSVDGAALTLGTDYMAVPPMGSTFPFGRALSGRGLQVVYGGRIGAETIDPAQAAGKVVVFAPERGQDGQPDYRFWRGSRLERYAGAAAVVVASLDVSPPGIRGFFGQEQVGMRQEEASAPAPLGLVVTTAAAERLLGAPLDSLRVGAAGRTVAAAVRWAETPAAAPARNVVAVLPGRDPALRGQYVVIGAHNDHDGVQGPAVDHDSVRAYNAVMRPEGANSPAGTPTAEQAARIRAARDSLRRLRPVRMDSIFNGADDDGSGTVVLLEIAEHLASLPEARRPRRSILFVSHTAEELGLLGSEWFTDHPTVPRDSIVTALNMDMVGRGRAEDVKGGGPRSIQMIGSRRLSTELGGLIDGLNAGRPAALRMDVDYSFDAPGHPYNRYCRSDHFNYARHGIPITYFSLGYHKDYHMVTDEPQYIDYDHMALVGNFVRDVAVAVANLDRRPVVDGPRRDPNAPCRQ